uniref:DNA meiotic recombinase 1 n=1 Tax=Lepisosteus oculatus TaxID=7918 RepID=W5N1H6_LEPOC|nr:PREDICTED: meiotic recombination protein DMC1/LIM15 homolog [Lepisosteus oculatus]
MTTRKALCNVKGLSEAKVDKIKEAAGKMLEKGFVTAYQYSEKRKQVFHISTGSAEFELRAERGHPSRPHTLTGIPLLPAFQPLRSFRFFISSRE